MLLWFEFILVSCENWNNLERYVLLLYYAYFWAYSWVILHSKWSKNVITQLSSLEFSVLLRKLENVV